MRRRLSSWNLLFGSRGERTAARYLKGQHYRILRRNFRCRAGEIDVIALDGDMTVFVEVKTRAGDEHQDPLETVGPAKWSRIERAARYYLMQCGEQGQTGRFDLIAITWPPRGDPIIEHIEDAFQPRGF